MLIFLFFCILIPEPVDFLIILDVCVETMFSKCSFEKVLANFTLPNTMITPGKIGQSNRKESAIETGDECIRVGA